MNKNLLGISALHANKLLTDKFPSDDCNAAYQAVAYELEYWAWTQLFPSTSGPFGGVGGQAMTTFTIEAWTDGYYAVLFCNGRVLKVVDKFECQMRV